MAASDHEVCPACGAGTAAERWCGVCGLDLRGDVAAALRNLASRLAATELELTTISARRDALATELAHRRWESDRRAAAPVSAVAGALPEFRPFDRPGRTGTRPEWGVERVRNLLLWTGAALLALSALAFTAVAWSHLGPGGRAVLLVAFTVMSTVAASALRRRLPATAGAFTGLTIALALVDWQVVRRAGVAPGLSGAAWWAIGTGGVGVLSGGLGRIAAPLPARRAVALLLPASAVLVVAANANAAWSVALELALISAAVVAVDRLLASRLTDPVIHATLRVAAGAIWTVGPLFALGAAVAAGSFVETLVPAVAMLALTTAPGLAIVPRSGSRDATDRAPLAFLVLAAVIGAVLTLASTSVGPIGMMTLAAGLGGLAIVAAVRLADPWSRGARAAGIAAGAAGFVFAIAEAAVAELGPLAWLGSAWTGSSGARAARVVGGPNTRDAVVGGWCAVGILAVAAATIALTSHTRRKSSRVVDTPARQAAAAGFGLLAIVLAPSASGASALVACAVATGATALAMLGAARAARRHRDRALPSSFIVLIPAVPAAGWAALTRSTSITVFAVVAASALLAAVVGRNAWLRAAHAGIGAAAAIGLTSVAMLASGSARPSAGFAGLLVAAAVLLVGALARRDTHDGLVVEIVGALGIVGGVLLAVTSATWVAAGLTAMVPALLVASTRRDRTNIYASVAGAAALGATWAWLAAADVTVVEAYTLPAAAVALAAGTFAWKAGRGRSWLNLGPAVALALAPTVALAIARNDDGRAIAVGIAALTVLLVGAWQQLQAPIVLGAASLVSLGIAKVGPHAVRMPRWTMLAIAGALLLWIGTTFERRRDDVQRAARRLADLG
ncbi:MAG: hypothetical protein QOG50_2323 [Actinomycetota bacterium]|jgi:hypothetical protein|nr:hypothetical protein [Actinomycetota bacterium]